MRAHHATKTNGLTLCAIFITCILAPELAHKFKSDIVRRPKDPVVDYSAPHRWFDVVAGSRISDGPFIRNELSDLSVHKLNDFIASHPLPATSRFYLIVSAWDQFDDKALQSLFVHHPRACVHIFGLFQRVSESIISDSISQLHSAGYCVSQTHMSTEDLYSAARRTAPESHQWLRSEIAKFEQLREVDEIRDFLGFLLLFEYGGTYIGQKSFFLQPLPDLDRFIVLKNVTIVEDWAFDKEGMRELSSNLIRLEKGSRIARMVLKYCTLSSDFTMRPKETVAPLGSAALNYAFANYLQLAYVRAPALIPEDYVFNVDIELNAAALADEIETSASSFMQRMQRSYYAIQGARLPGLLHGHLDKVGVSMIGVAGAPENCHLMSSRTLIVRGMHSRLRGPHSVSLGNCTTRHSSDNGPLHVIVKTTHGTLSDDCVLGSSPRNVLYIAALRHIADINSFLSCISYHVSTPRSDLPHDVLEIRVMSAGRMIAMRVVDVLVFQHAVTVMAHTHGRIENINRMALTVQQWYPGTNIHCTNDNSSVREYSREPRMRWIQISHPGASFNTHRLLETITTPYVLFLDDNVGIESNSHLDTLLERLYLGEYDIASPRMISTEIESNDGMHKNTDGKYDCMRLDYIPDLFMARRNVLVRSQWNSEVRHGVFKRVERISQKLTNVNVITCKHATVKRLKII